MRLWRNLSQFLYRMGIEPLGAIETAARIVEKRVIKTESKTLDGQDEQSPDAPVSEANDGAHKLSHVDIQKSTVESPHADQAVNMILTNTDGNGAELRSSESHKYQSLRSGDRVTYRTNKGKKRSAVIVWTDGKQVKLNDSGGYSQ